MLRGVIVGHQQRPDRMTSDQHWFEDLARHMKSAYLRYSFTKGTTQEVDFICEQSQIVRGARVLDVGCGPGRHSLEFARRGMRVTGIDISQDFVDIAAQAARAEGLKDTRFVRMDARALSAKDDLHHRFDLVVCLCQCAFGLMLDDQHDVEILKGIRSCLVDGGVVVLSAFNAYFAVKHFEASHFDATRGICHESTEIRNEAGEPRTVDLWTGCYTPRELRLAFWQTGFEVVSISGVEPGQYSLADCSIDLPEFLVIAKATSVTH